ncbi:mitochondrial matrix Mmp37-domain-containing protein [Umbelopsis sp. PMI_123]|nr:mitochondrial matrix Mmp37-domain-containing protein [Umbelopsis sp. PMI_123]
MISSTPYRIFLNRTSQYSRSLFPVTRPYSSSAEQKKEPESSREKPNFFQRYKFNPSNIPDSPEFGTNQYINIDEEVKQRLKNVLNTFNAPIRYSFAYGSGVFQQKGYDSKNQPMVDFIFGVTHPHHWHSLNIQQNPHHYSAVRRFGSNFTTLVQDKIGAGVYFNPYVEIDGMVIKYGVVSIDRLCKDLLDWETLYIAGRMHKPVKILRDDARVRLANQVNLTEAVRVALLTLPSEFSETELYERIAGISYKGDFRMVIGENPNKVKNIVDKQLPHFRRVYSHLLEDLPNVAVLENGLVQQDKNPKFQSLMVQKLSKTLYQKILLEHRRYARIKGLQLPEEKDLLHQQIVHSPDLNRYINRGLFEIIAWPALTQSAKGIITAGPTRTARYAGEKLKKWWQAKK